MANNQLSRRDFLLRVSVLGVGAGTLVSACGGGQSGGQSDTPPPPEPAPETATAVASPCTDLSALTEDEVRMRHEVYQYVDVTTDPMKPCSSCALFVPPAEGATCGTCNLVKGPIAPGGSCISFALKQTA